MAKIDLFKFFRLDFSIRNLGISLIAIFSLEFIPNVSLALLTLVQVLLVQMHSFSMNNYFDSILWDENNYINGLLRSHFNKKVLIFLTILPLLVLIFTLPWSNVYFLILVGYVILFLLYQAPPWRLKNQYLSSIIINSLCLGLILYIYPYLFLAGRLSLTSVIFSIIFFFYLAFHEIVHQIAHMGRDKIYSLPKAVGIRRTINVAILFLMIPIIIATLILLLNPLKYFFFTGTIIFSLMRIIKLMRAEPSPKQFKYIRDRFDKFYSLQEGIYYLIFLSLIKFIEIN